MGELSPDMIALHSRGKYVDGDPARIKMLGGSGPGDLIGRSILEIIHPGMLRNGQERIRQLEQGKGVALLEEKYIRFDGRIVDVECRPPQSSFRASPWSRLLPGT